MSQIGPPYWSVVPHHTRVLVLVLYNHSTYPVELTIRLHNSKFGPLPTYFHLLSTEI